MPSKIVESESMWCVLPWAILTHDKLNPQEKLLFAEITALQRKDGFCYATNSYLGKTLNMSARTVMRGITKMVELKLIFTRYENKKYRSGRRLYINYEKSVRPPVTNLVHPCDKFGTPACQEWHTKRIDIENRKRKDRAGFEELRKKIKSLTQARSFV